MLRQNGAMLLHVDRTVKSGDEEEEEKGNKLFTMNIYDEKLFSICGTVRKLRHALSSNRVIGFKERLE